MEASDTPFLSILPKVCVLLLYSSQDNVWAHIPKTRRRWNCGYIGALWWWVAHLSMQWVYRLRPTPILYARIHHPPCVCSRNPWNTRWVCSFLCYHAPKSPFCQKALLLCEGAVSALANHLRGRILLHFVLNPRLNIIPPLILQLFEQHHLSSKSYPYKCAQNLLCAQDFASPNFLHTVKLSQLFL